MRNSLTALLGALAALSAAPAFAQDAVRPEAAPIPSISPVPRSYVTAPVWARPPAPEYPELALDLGIEAWVMVECDLDRRSGALSACEAVSQSFPGMDFDRRAAQAGERARADVRIFADEPAVGRGRFRLIFAMPPGSDAEFRSRPWSGTAPTPETLAQARATIAARDGLPADFFVLDVGPAWAPLRDQVNREFDAEARDVWALVLARGSRGERRDIVRNDVWTSSSRLEIWARRHPEAGALQRRMKARLRELMCEGRTCTLPRTRRAAE